MLFRQLDDENHALPNRVETERLGPCGRFFRSADRHAGNGLAVEEPLQRGERVVRRDAVCVGAGADKYADYFETCRRKRNVIDYTRSHVATETEATEIVKKATEFDGFVEGWIESKFPNLKR